MEASRRHRRLDAGDAIAMRPRVPYRSSWEVLDADVTMLDRRLIDDVAAELTGGRGPVDLDFDAAVSRLAAAQWSQTTTLVRHVALANATSSDGALLADSPSRLLVTTALTSFPNTTRAGPEVRPARAGPESLRRAVVFVDANLHTPISLGDLAEAARVSPRALNLTFQRYHQTSPMGYVRRARLDRAHADLKAAQPGDGQSVTAIAARWGFFSLPRFGVTYRQAYGQPPSRTLRRG